MAPCWRAGPWELRVANQEKDRLGDKLKDAERAREEKFFADREKELLAKLRAKQQSEGEKDPEDSKT